jgi:secreted Zn-dependent insulinase-like peptidase
VGSSKGRSALPASQSSIYNFPHDFTYGVKPKSYSKLEIKSPSAVRTAPAAYEVELIVLALSDIVELITAPAILASVDIACIKASALVSSPFASVTP